MYGIAKQERDMNEQIISEHDQAEKWRIQMLEWKLKYETLFQEHAACEVSAVNKASKQNQPAAHILGRAGLYVCP